MNLGPKKDGSPNTDFFLSPESLQGFESVRLWLQKHHKKVCGKKLEMEAILLMLLCENENLRYLPRLQYVSADPPTKESLAQLIIQLIQFQETKLGKNAQEPTLTTRLPVSLRCGENCFHSITGILGISRCDSSWTSSPVAHCA